MVAGATKGFMMASGFKNPPSFGDKETNYETWRNEIDIWCLVTEVKVEKQALAVALSLQGQARAIALELDKAKLNDKDGMKFLLEALDKVFKRNEIDILYTQYSNFEKLERQKDQNISEYIVEFERQYNKMKSKAMALPEAVLAFKLLDKAGLDQRDKQLALTACAQINFENMKSALKRIFGEGSTNCHDFGVSVKQEVYYSRNSSSTKFKRFPKPEEGKQKGTNPFDRQGRRTKCAVCSSVFHWAKDCPHKDVKYVEETEDCDMVMFTKCPQNHNIVFMTESFGSAILDTACTRTVCGTRWLYDYIESLSQEDKESITEEKSERLFRFGDSSQVKAVKNVVIPAVIGGKNCKISTDVVDLELPLLLSKASLKKANAVINLNDDEAVMFGQAVKLEQTSSGHYCVNLRSKSKDNQSEVNDVLTVLDDLSSKEKTEAIKKLHRQFGHPSQQKLKDLLKGANVSDKEVFNILSQVVDDCDFCARHKKTPSRPAVSLPMANDFNELVAVDLHQLEDRIWYLHIVDIFTRFSAGGIVRSKDASVVGDEFVKSWISFFGPPQKLFSDNGGEFANEHMAQLGHQFNFELLTTAAYAPWSNGICERHNMTLTEIIKKVKSDRNVDYETALAWALMAKNTMSNVTGYSSYQLVFGRNPNLPSIFTDKLPALSGETTSQIVGKHISSLYATRKAYTEAECSERIRRALRKQTRTSSEEIYRNGEKVYYKRPNDAAWRGPAKVIGQDGVVVFVRHASQLVRVHVCRLQKVKREESSHQDTTALKKAAPFDKHEEQLSEEHERKEKDSELPEPKVTEENDESSDQDQSEIEDNLEKSSPDSLTVQPVASLKPGQTILFQEKEDESPMKAVVLGRAGKSTGKYKSWFNIGVEQDSGIYEEKAIDISGLAKLSVVQDVTDQTIHCEEVCVVGNEDFAEAKERELKSWKDNGVYTEVRDEGQDWISSRWVLDYKEKDGIRTPKARLVIRGFEESTKDIEKASPTCSSEGLKMVLAVMAQNDWKPKTIDIKTAFLQGNNLEREIFIKPPHETRKKDTLWKLEKCVYGLADASLHWYKRVKAFMESIGGKVSTMDPAIFHWHNKDNKVVGILACHVDDFLYSGSEDFVESKGREIRIEFTVGKESEDSFKYVGMKIESKNDCITLDQNEYAKGLKMIAISKERQRQKQCPITDDERKIMKAKIGQLLWLGRQTRPDLMYDASNLSSIVNTARVKDMIETNKVLGRAINVQVTLRYEKLEKPRMVVYSDASLGNSATGNTQGGYFLALQGKESFTPLAWCSRKLRRVARSTLAAETLAMVDSMDSAIFSASLFTELMTGNIQPESVHITLITDCKSLHDNLGSGKAVIEKRLRIEMAAIKEAIERKIVNKAVWVSTADQLADVLTKKGASPLRLLAALEKGKLL